MTSLTVPKQMGVYWLRQDGESRVDACRATLVELVNTTGGQTTGDSFEYRMAA